MRKWMAGVLAGVMLAGALTLEAGAAPVPDTQNPGQSGQEQETVGLFLDVPEDTYYAPWVRWAVERGMASGTGEGMFSPDAQCTTAQVVTMLWRSVGSPEPVGPNSFSDVPAGCYYEKAAVWAAEAGLVSGTEFGGDGLCSRGTIVTMLWKLAGKPAAQQESQSGTEWNLLLVNPWNPVPQDFSITLSQIEGSDYSVDERCVDALNQMMAHCWWAGNRPVVCSAYRTPEKQEQLFAKAVAKWMGFGLSRADAEREAAQETAVPGTSEHQAGLAVDIIDAGYPKLNEKQASMPTQKWLMEHCWEYGFILRYPEDKSEITGIIYEPWHYRYVGVETAKVIHEQGLCLEEYLQQRAEYQSAVAWAWEKGVTASQNVDDFAPYNTCTRAQLVTFLHQALAES